MGNELSGQVYSATEALCGQLDPREHPGRAVATGAAVLVGSSVLLGVLPWLSDCRESRRLSARRKSKQASREMVLQVIADKLRDIQISDDLKKSISSMSLPELVRSLENGKIKPSDVLAVYQEKALKAHSQTNCLVEPILDADRLAAEADIQPVGPFCGLPISIKDNYGVAGYDSSIGCTRYACSPVQEDCVLVKVLKKQGAIPFMKTNVPQTMMSWGCCNPIYGGTVNPLDPTRGPGGSSGGEAALIAGGGSIIGIGSDIGGSIRIPSNMCGICGLKPTVGRISSKGTHPHGKGQALVKAACGPMANDVDSLVFFMRNVLVPYMFIEDPSVPPIPFNSQEYEDKRPLRIGFYTCDDYTQAVPAMERGVMEAKAVLEKAGHSLVPWQPPHVGDGDLLVMFAKTVSGDGAKIYADALKNDKVDASMKLPILQNRYPLLARYVAKPLLKLLGEKKMTQAAASVAGLSSVTEWWNLTEKVENFRKEVIEDWQIRGLDAVICPGFGCPAMPCGTAGDAMGAATYTMLYNVLNFPAGSVPVTKVTSEDEAKMADFPCTELWDRTIKKGMKGSTGLPVNVQVATLPWKEELCLRVMKEIETEIKKTT